MNTTNPWPVEARLENIENLQMRLLNTVQEEFDLLHSEITTLKKQMNLIDQKLDVLSRSIIF